MIVIMDPNDSGVWAHGKGLSLLYGEKVKAFDALTQQAFSSENRFTFIGHGDLGTYSDEKPLTPEEFADSLMKNGLPNNKPISIDLISCQIGLINNDSSYALNFAAYLYKKGYTNVQVNVVNNLIFNDKTQFMFLAPKDDFSMAVVYLPVRSQSNYEAEIQAKVEPLKKRAEDVSNQIQNYFSQSSSDSGTTIPQSSRTKRGEQYGELLSEKCKLEKNTKMTYQNIMNVHFKTAAVLPTDIRFAFDANQNFQITHQTLNLDISSARKDALVIVNNRIAELETERRRTQNSKMPAMFFGVDLKTNKYKSEQLNVLRKALTDNSKDVNKEISTLLGNKDVSTKRTQTALLQIQSLLKNEPAPQPSPGKRGST